MQKVYMMLYGKLPRHAVDNHPVAQHGEVKGSAIVADKRRVVAKFMQKRLQRAATCKTADARFETTAAKAQREAHQLPLRARPIQRGYHHQYPAHICHYQ